MQSAFYAIFEGFESFYKTGAYRNFSERLGGLILERGLYLMGAYIRNFTVMNGLRERFSLKIALVPVSGK